MARLGRREPERRVYRGTALNAKTGLLDHAPVVCFGGFAVGAPERLRHPHEILPLGFGDETREHEELAPVLPREPREMGAIGLDGTQNAQACAHLFVGQRRAGFAE